HLGFLKCRSLPKDTVLVGCIGNVGKIGMVFDDKSATNQQINAVICNKDNYSHFIYYCLNGSRARLENVADKTTLPILNKTNFENFEIAVPPLDEQRKIAAVLGVVQRAIEQQECLLALTDELKKTLLHQLFTQGLRGEPQKQTEIGPVPESWEVAKLGNIATSKSGGTPSRTKPEYWDGGSIPWVKTGEVDYRVINDTEEKITSAGLANSSARIFPVGTLLMAMYGQGITRGKVAILGIEAATNQACVAIFPCEDVNTKFLYYFFEGKYEYIRNLGHGANQKNLSAEILKGVTVAYPKDREEQKSVVGSLEALDKKLSLHERKRAALTDLFRTLLHQLMTAQIRVHDLDLPELELKSKTERVA
ncbi:MAG: restriction endonuclease subunit S, partial [Gallionellaceae bacterium]|nr:restriction endonuclease subunit S [Gallionellaceae bacterium]